MRSWCPCACRQRTHAGSAGRWIWRMADERTAKLFSAISLSKPRAKSTEFHCSLGSYDYHLNHAVIIIYLSGRVRPSGSWSPRSNVTCHLMVAIGELRSSFTPSDLRTIGELATSRICGQL